MVDFDGDDSWRADWCDSTTEEEKKMDEKEITRTDGEVDWSKMAIGTNKKEPQYDEVNHPQRYTGQCSVECIDMMELTYGSTAVINFCLCNAFKYLWRYKAKNGKEDIAKAEWYLDHVSKMMDSDCRLRDMFFRQHDNLCKLYDKIIEKEGAKNEE